MAEDGLSAYFCLFPQQVLSHEINLPSPCLFYVVYRGCCQTWHVESKEFETGFQNSSFRPFPDLNTSKNSTANLKTISRTKFSIFKTCFLINCVGLLHGVSKKKKIEESIAQ
jgi:hypothetical protein